MLALLLAILAADPEPAGRVKILARGPWTHPIFGGKKGKPVVARSADEAMVFTPHVARSEDREFTTRDVDRELFTALKVKAIDWKKQMVVAVLAGGQPAGYKVEIQAVTREKGVLTVKWRLQEPKKAGPDILTFPSECVLIPRHDGKVVFDPPLEK